MWERSAIRPIWAGGRAHSQDEVDVIVMEDPEEDQLDSRPERRDHARLDRELDQLVEHVLRLHPVRG